MGSAPIREAIRPAPIQLGAQHGRAHAARPDRKKSGPKTRRGGTDLIGVDAHRGAGNVAGDFNFPAVHNSILPRVTIQFHNIGDFNFTAW